MIWEISIVLAFAALGVVRVMWESKANENDPLPSREEEQESWDAIK